MTDELRSTILSTLARFTGKAVSWRFVKQTSGFIPTIERFHNLITGIYKPAWSEYALSIVVRPGSPYDHKDEIVFLEDGRWLMTYSPRSGGLDISDNKALMRCKDQRIPLGVFKQVTQERHHEQGSTYLVLGLGVITDYDARSDVFIVESVDRSALERVTSVIADDEERYAVQLYAQLTNEFRPFINEENVTYSVSAPKRDTAFRKMILREYDFTCSVCETKFHLGELVEAQAAHIIPKRKNGTDDPRNGLALCRSHHWAFDAGIFTLAEDYTILLSPIVAKAETHNFRLLDYEGKLISFPDRQVIYPHPDALAWHRQNTWQKQ
jgi:hypothetical protein